MLLPLTCLKRDFLKVLQSLRGYIDTILPKSLGDIVKVAYRQACPEAVVHDSAHNLCKCSYDYQTIPPQKQTKTSRSSQITHHLFFFCASKRRTFSSLNGF